MYRLGWFTTARGPGSRGLFQSVHRAILSGEIPARIEFVFCSREPGEAEATDSFFDLVRGYRIPLVTLSLRRFKAEQGAREAGKGLPAWRLDYDRAVMARLAEFKPDLCVLAGYMLIAGPEMCRRYDMINLHPAAPRGPAGTWQEVIWQLIRERARESGVMTHLVTPELDKGPCVSYCTFPITGEEFDPCWAEIGGRAVEEIKSREGESNALFKLIRQHGLKREGILTTATVKAFAEGKVRITENKQVVDALGNLIISGCDLTEEVNRKLRDCSTLSP